MTENIGERKNRHIDVAMRPSAQMAIATGLEHIRFEPNALPELSLAEIDTSTVFLRKSLSMPLIISSMSGGTQRALTLNRALARAAEQNGIALALGSMRIALEDETARASFQLRDLAPNIPILANLGGAQLAQKAGVDNALRCLEIAEADAMIIHLNPLQEAIQCTGDTDWRHVTKALADLVRRSSQPIIAKEVGHGIGLQTAQRLMDCGITYIDIAAAGGTSWAGIEAQVDAAAYQVGEPFHDWGIPLVASLNQLAGLTQARLIASGGIRSGLDVAKVIRLGARLAGAAQPFLLAYEAGEVALQQHIECWRAQLKIAMFATGSATLADLKCAPLIANTGC